jgi:hypothetical protein
VNREPNLDDLIGAGTTGAERQRLQNVHELLLEAGPPPELSPELEEGPNLKMTLAKRRRVKRQRAMLLLAAAITAFFVFVGGYAVGNTKSGSSTNTTQAARIVKQISLVGTSLAPRAEAALEVWRPQAGNWPMTLKTSGLPKLPAHEYYEVYLVRNGKPWGSCGTFRVAGSSKQVTVTLTAPYSLEKGDSWVVTQPGAGGTEPGPTVLKPVSA